MMKTSVIGYPRIGASRELKFALEQYFAGKLSSEQLHVTAKALREKHWRQQASQQIDFISSNDFSYYDQVLDTAYLFNIVPARYRELQLNELDTYLAMARGYQGEQGDVKALPMKKWFNTNYHYIVPELDHDTDIKLIGTKIFDEFSEAKQLGIATKPTLIGPFTLLKLATVTPNRSRAQVVEQLASAYQAVLKRLDELGADWLQLEEPSLVVDLNDEDLVLLEQLYEGLHTKNVRTKLLVQTYFGDVRDSYEKLKQLPIDGLGIDFIEGVQSFSLLAQSPLPDHLTLFAGLINGKNIWCNSYEHTITQLNKLKPYAKHIVLSTSCSLLHVPYSLKQEPTLSVEQRKHLAFAEEKLIELAQLKDVINSERYDNHPLYKANSSIKHEVRFVKNETLSTQLSALKEVDFTRLPLFNERQRIQKEALQLGLLPTTTIGSFPQTADVRANRAAFKKGTISKEQYKQFNLEKIAECVRQQDKLGLDVLVHGEFERNDMVEYFGESLDGFLFTQLGWVQSYGTRCVKPPIIWGDITRPQAITVDYTVYANSLTNKRVKGMLTGPVTILNWSFPREDISLQEMAYQLALSIREEVLDLEANGIEIIQIDEAALREKLPLRRTDWHEHYLSWAIPAFRLTHSQVKATTQIHTHMCYSQFSDIIRDIDAMDADVITFEASRSDLSIIDDLHAVNFQTEVGPGVYDIHSPRIPSVEELIEVIAHIAEKVSIEKLWINPDCGLKTRGEKETWASLENLVAATAQVRNKLKAHTLS